MNDTLQGRLFRRLDESPGGPALAFLEPDGRFSWRTVEEVFERAGRFGAGLLESGCRPGDRCVIVLPSDEECAHVLLGAFLAGTVPLLVAPPFLHRSRHSALSSNLEHTVETVRPAAVVCPARSREEYEEAFRTDLDAVILDPPSLARVATPSDPSLSIRPDVKPKDTVALQLTSGTTGVPRICRWRQENLLAALDGMRETMALVPEDVCFNWTPLYHDMGLVNNFLLCLGAGTPLVMLEPTEFVKRPSLWIRGMSDTKATISWSPNFGYALAATRVEEEELTGVRLDRVRAFWNAAERIHVETYLQFHERFSPHGLRFEALKTNFGCAENIGGATFTALDESFRWEEVDVRALHRDRVAKPVEPGRSGTVEAIASAGRPVPGMRIVISDPEGRSLGEGHVGEVLLDTPSSMTEYLGDDTATRRAFVDGLVRTGDLGYVRDGELYWVGRVRERITVRGKKIDPSEFESIVLSIPELRPGCFVAFGVPDPEIGTERPVLMAEVRYRDGRTFEALIEEIQQAVHERLNLLLDDIVLVEKGTLAKTSSGKRRHRHFRDVYVEGDVAFLSRKRGRGFRASGRC